MLQNFNNNNKKSISDGRTEGPACTHRIVIDENGSCDLGTRGKTIYFYYTSVKQKRERKLGR